MDPITPLSFLLITALVVMILGVITFASGLVVLIYRISGRHVRTLATQTTQLANKGVAEEIAGLVGNASLLLDSLNQFLRTVAGVGVFLCILGLLMVGAAGWLAVQLYPVWP